MRMRRLRVSDGFSLIELMVALAIGSFLIAGAVVVYSNSRKTYTINETTARLEENSRFIFSMMEPDLQLAGYYGFSNLPEEFKFISGGSLGAPIATSNLTPASPAAAVGGGGQACGNNFAVNLLLTVEGNDNGYALACPVDPEGVAAAAGADTLTIRRAATTALAGPSGAQLQLLTTRLGAGQYIIADGLMPASPVITANIVELRNLVVNSYYVSTTSKNRPGIPALRRKTLIAGPKFDDKEVMAGVEDMQVQFGIDTGDYNGDGVIDPGVDADGDGLPDHPEGIATRYVSPGNPAFANFQVVSVRIWLMLRAEQAEQGFIDNKAYSYAGKVFTPAGANAQFRRLLVTRTFQLRNSRTL